MKVSKDVCAGGDLDDFFFFQAEDGIRDLVRSRGLGDVYKRQTLALSEIFFLTSALLVFFFPLFFKFSCLFEVPDKYVDEYQHSQHNAY